MLVGNCIYFLYLNEILRPARFG